jgi:hypothetical protein
MEGLAQFDAFLAVNGHPRMVADIRAEHVKSFRRRSRATRTPER